MRVLFLWPTSVGRVAKTELKYGQDTQIKEMAQNIIKAQEEEISMMKTWLKKNGQ